LRCFPTPSWDSELTVADTSHDAFEQPSNPRCFVWRYMSLPKLLDLVETSELFYASASLMPDKFEGTITKRDLRSLRHDAKQAGQDFAATGFGSLMADVRRGTFLNCWCMHEIESDAHWRIYGSGDIGVAVRSSYDRLVRLTPECDNIGCVRYIDYDSARVLHGNVLATLMHKRREFAHELEVRLVRWITEEGRKLTLTGPTTTRLSRRDPSLRSYPYGVRVKIDLDALIESIWISPYAPDWHAEAINSYLRRVGLDRRLQRSRLLDKPHL
jgi:hypothetical protein